MARAPQIKPVATVTRPRPQRGGTPAGMEGVRPGSPAAIAAGFGRPQRQTAARPGGTRAPVAESRIAPPTAAAAAPPPPPPAPTFQPTSAWWMSQLAADPRYMTTAPLLDERRAGIGRSYGFTIARDAQGRPLYRTAAGAIGITQQFDDKGAIVYRDAAGNTYQPGDLQLDIQRIGRGQAGYLSGQFGAAEAGSEAQQYRISDESARAGLRRSGMRASTQAQEAAALQSALAGLTSRAGAELAGVDERFAELYREIYGDLAKKAEELAAPATPPATETPASQTPAAATSGTPETGLNTGQALTPEQFAEQIRGVSNMGKNADRKTMIRLYRQLASRYSLTPAQLRRLTKLLRDEYGVGL